MHLQDVETLREMYEATILAHVALVGQVDEYESGSVVDASVDAYRHSILARETRADPFGRWTLVRDATFEQFRNGTMEVYVPVDNGAVSDKYIRDCQVAGGNNARTVVVNHPSHTREYRKTVCILGTVFQDQAYFLVRRDRSGYPDLLNEPLTVHLVCGYDKNPDNNIVIDGRNIAIDDIEERYRFETYFESPKKYRVTLFANQDTVRFSVPRFSGPFDSGEVSEGDLRKVRCSIRGAVEGVDSPLSEEDTSLPEYGDTFVDEDMLTATVTVSEHGSDDDTKTLHGYMSSMLSGVNADERIERMGSALYYTYFLGWHTGFIRMPYFSIQDLLSALPYTVPDPDGKGRSDNASVLQALNNNENLRRYQLLASLFVDESDGRFPVEHFGFLTPDEAKERYKSEYSARFDAYFGRALGVFLQELPPRYRQQ